MKSEHLVGTSIPRFTYDTPTVPGNDFYALCEGTRPLCMIFLPGFDHPVTREYVTRYLKTLPALKGVRLACVVRSSAQSVAAATRGSDFPFPVICDAPGVLYGYLGVEQTRGLLSWSFAAQKIFKAAKDAGVLNLESDYYTSFFSMSEYDGKRYVVPRSMDSVVTYYNTDILAAAGIDPKTDARFNNAFTWEQFNSLLDDVNTYLTSAQAKTDGYADCYALDPCFEWEAVYNPIMQSYGANIFDENGNITVESENMTEMATMINTISKKGRIIKPYSSAYNFKAGKCAFFFSSYGPTKMNEELAVRGKFDALPFPLIGENGKIGCGFAGWGISSRSSATQRDLAWQFLSYMISKEGQMALINNGLATPSIRIDLAEEKQWSKGFENLNLDAWLVSEDKKICTDYFVKFDPSKMFGIQNAVQNFMKNISDFSKNNSVTYFIGSFKSDLEAAIA